MKTENQILVGDSVLVMDELKDSSIDLVVTSPPYDALRDYNGFTLDLLAIGKQCFRVLKDGGICAVIIQDQTKDFAKSLTSFRLAVDWCDKVGFRLFECCIYQKQGVEGAWWKQRFRVDHEYILLFMKGDRPLYFNKEPLKIPSKHGGKTLTGAAIRLKNGKNLPSRKVNINKLKCRGTIWNYITCGDGSKLKHKHPATFPNMLPFDLIDCFCPQNGIVLDPFNGSGTTCVAAKSLGRKYIGIDCSDEYCKIAKERVLTEKIERKVDVMPENKKRMLHLLELCSKRLSKLIKESDDEWDYDGIVKRSLRGKELITSDCKIGVDILYPVW